MIFNNSDVKGADVSFWQDDNSTPQQIDFNKMKSASADFVIIRAGQNTWVDQDFQFNWRMAKEAGIPRGAYWFYDSRSDPVRQADIFASLFKFDPPELELWLDLEEHYGGSWAGWQNWKRFILRLQALLPNVKIGIYTGFYYITGQIPESEMAFFAQFVLWLAWYTKDSEGNFTPVPDFVRVPRPWTSVLYWQWGTPPWGLQWGCESMEIDMNLFNGTIQQFNSRYILGETMSYMELKPNVASEYRSVRGDTNYPTVPHIYGSAANRIQPGNIAKADLNSFYVYSTDVYVSGVLAAKAGDKWWQIYEANGAPMDGWVAETHKSVRYLDVRLVGDEPPPPPSENHVIEIFIDGVLEFRKELV